MRISDGSSDVCSSDLAGSSADYRAEASNAGSKRRHRADECRVDPQNRSRSEEHTSELQSLMRTSYAVFCLKKKKMKVHDRVRVVPKMSTTQQREHLVHDVECSEHRTPQRRTPF